MENSESDIYENSDLSNNLLEKRFSPLKQEFLNSSRGSSYDVEECFKNANSMSNINPRFAVEVDCFSLQYSANPR